MERIVIVEGLDGFEYNEIIDDERELIGLEIYGTFGLVRDDNEALKIPEVD